MAKGTFLVNPELNNNDVDLTASSQLGRRAGAPVPFATNSNLLSVTTLGDPGDDLAHDFEIFGSQAQPFYAPFDSTDAKLYTAPESPTSMGATIACGASAKVALAATDDRLYAIVADAGALKVFDWDGSAWNLLASITGLADDSGGISAAPIGQNVYVAVANNTDAVVELYRFNTRSNTIGQISAAFADTDTLTVTGVALATNGAIYALLVAHDTDVDSYFGSLNDMTKNDQTINDLFSSAWTTGDDVRCPGIAFVKGIGFVAAFRCGTGTSKLRLAFSADGDDWRQFQNFKKKTSEPTLATPWAAGMNCAVTGENKRVFVWRATAAALDGAATDIKQQWFDGYQTWRTEIDADGGAGVDPGTQVAAANWRGAMYYGWRSSSTEITVLVTNTLTTTNSGYYRELVTGDPMFVAGLDDDSRTALFFVATGSIREGDKFRIAAAEYDYRVAHLLDDFMSKVWRGTFNEDQTIVFDAGSGRAFVLNAIALFRTNFPLATVEIDDDVAFGSPSTSQLISSVVQNPAVVSVDRNRIVFAAGAFEKEQYAPGLAKYWVKTSVGIFPILDNDDFSLKVDGNAFGVLAAEVVWIYRNSFGYLWSTPQTAGRYLRLTIPSIGTHEGYYEIARVLFGYRFEPPIDYRIEWLRRYGQTQARTELKSGARFNTLLNFAQRPAWTLTFRHYLENVRPVASFFGRTGGGVRLFGFWPDPTMLSGDQPEVFPMYFTTDPPEIRDMGAGAAELSCVIEGQI